MTDTAKLRAGVAVNKCPCEFPQCTHTTYGIAETESLMRLAADEIEGLRAENARLQVENNRLFNAGRGVMPRNRTHPVDKDPTI